MEVLFFSIFIGLLINEVSDLSPWLACKLVRWSARLRYADPAEADDLAIELAAYITHRPGKLLKLLVAFGFLAAGLLRRLRRGLRRHVGSFMDQPWTWAGQFHGFTLMVSLCSVLLFHSAAAVAGYTFLFFVLGPISGRIEKMKKAGRVSRLQAPYTFVLVFIAVPAAYLTVIAMAIYSLIQIIEGHTSAGMVAALIFNLVMLTTPLNWRMIARVQAHIEKAESAEAPRPGRGSIG